MQQLEFLLCRARKDADNQPRLIVCGERDIVRIAAYRLEIALLLIYSAVGESDRAAPCGQINPLYAHLTREVARERDIHHIDERLGRLAVRRGQFLYQRVGVLSALYGRYLVIYLELVVDVGDIRAVELGVRIHRYLAIGIVGLGHTLRLVEPLINKRDVITRSIKFLLQTYNLCSLGSRHVCSSLCSN